MTAPPELIVDLSAWIIQDGNYPDFERDQQMSFALEFLHSSDLQACEPARPQSLALHAVERSAIYDAVGTVVHVAAEWWVVDFGILAFRKERPSKHKFREGDCVRGRVSLGVDPFFYFEQYAKQDEALALIYDWMIRKIEIQTAPRIETRPKYLERDVRLLGWRSVEKTDAWKDDSGSAEYLLHCHRAGAPPRRTLRKG